MNKYLKLSLFGFLAWLIPFLASFPFFTKDGGLLINIDLFKSVMVVVGTLVAAILLIIYFKKIHTAFIREGIIVGLIWFAINIGLDLLILIPMSEMSYPDYFMQIGVRYLSIPVIAIMTGVLLAKKK